MPRAVLLRTLTLALAFLHSFPARKHLGAFIAAPSWTEGWKGIGAAVAIGLYLLPVSTQTHGLQLLWKRRWVLRAAGFVLAAVHLVPALDHVPRLVASPAFADAWRGVGATIAIAWFVAPLQIQALLLARLARAVRGSNFEKAVHAVHSP